MPRRLPRELAGKTKIETADDVRMRNAGRMTGVARTETGIEIETEIETEEIEVVAVVAVEVEVGQATMDPPVAVVAVETETETGTDLAIETETETETEGVIGSALGLDHPVTAALGAGISSRERDYFHCSPGFY